MATCHRLTESEYLDLVPVETAALAAIGAGVDPDTPVPTCPGWTMATLMKHVGGTQRWALDMVHRLAAERLDSRLVRLDLPDTPVGYPAWLAGGAGTLVETLRVADPAAPMWAWGADRHARFWPRRMVHEVTVHRADAELAVGREPQVGTPVAADGVDELLDNLPGARWRPAVAQLRGGGETVGLAATDTDAAWLVTLTPDGYAWTHADTAPDATVRGRAADLYLFAWGRRQAADRDRFEVTGDRALVDHWVAHSAV